jgi:hypothetical protein
MEPNGLEKAANKYGEFIFFSVRFVTGQWRSCL